MTFFAVVFFHDEFYARKREENQQKGYILLKKNKYVFGYEIFSYNGKIITRL